MKTSDIATSPSTGPGEVAPDASKAGEESSVTASTLAAYVPPDPTEIDISPVALAFWSRTLGVEAGRLKDAVGRVGPELETVKQDLGVGGVG